MLTYILSFCLGSCFGSFFAVVSERLPLGNSLITPASHCTNCQTRLCPRELIPVASYLCLKGRCRHCHHSYPRTTLIAEIATGLIFSLLTAANLWTLNFIPGLLLIMAALLLSLTDLLYLRVEPLIFYPLTLCTFCSIVSLNTSFTIHLADSLLVGIGLRIVARLLPDSLGHGDILLLSAWGLFLGAYALNLIILWASLFGLLYGIKRPSQSAPIPFVPFLTGALISYLIWQYSS